MGQKNTPTKLQHNKRLILAHPVCALCERIFFSFSVCAALQHLNTAAFQSKFHVAVKTRSQYRAMSCCPHTAHAPHRSRRLGSGQYQPISIHQLQLNDTGLINIHFSFDQPPAILMRRCYGIIRLLPTVTIMDKSIFMSGRLTADDSTSEELLLAGA